MRCSQIIAGESVVCWGVAGIVFCRVYTAQCGLGNGRVRYSVIEKVKIHQRVSAGWAWTKLASQKMFFFTLHCAGYLRVD